MNKGYPELCMSMYRLLYAVILELILAHTKKSFVVNQLSGWLGVHSLCLFIFKYFISHIYSNSKMIAYLINI